MERVLQRVAAIKMGDPLDTETMMGAQAVSYTHLRAHETVLDLVCRLLLEKKTTDKKNNTQQRHTSTYKCIR